MEAFFSHIRRALFGGSLTSEQVAGIKEILDACQRHHVTDKRQIAYVLATAYHETGRRMTPVRETFAPTDAVAIARLDAAWAAGKLKQVSQPYWRENWFGRGYVQLTHRYNYERMGRRLNVDLIGDPGKAMNPRISADILVVGMKEGLFTGRKLFEFFSDGKADWRDARRVVNGLDRADDIAGYAREFYAGLRAVGALPVKEIVGTAVGGGGAAAAAKEAGWGWAEAFGIAFAVGVVILVCFIIWNKRKKA